MFIVTAKTNCGRLPQILERIETGILKDVSHERKKTGIEAVVRTS